MIKAGLPDLSATEGSHALLPCMASGSPKPDITWEKDGQPVSGAEGKFAIQPSGELLVKHSEVRPQPHRAQRGIIREVTQQTSTEHPLFVMLCAECF